MFGEQAALKQLEGMDFHQISATINKAIESGWQNLYPEHGKGKNGKQNSNLSHAEDLAADFARRHGAE